MGAGVKRVSRGAGGGRGGTAAGVARGGRGGGVGQGPVRFGLCPLPRRVPLAAFCWATNGSGRWLECVGNGAAGVFEYWAGAAPCIGEQSDQAGAPPEEPAKILRRWKASKMSGCAGRG